MEDISEEAQLCRAPPDLEESPSICSTYLHMNVTQRFGIKLIFTLHAPPPPDGLRGEDLFEFLADEGDVRQRGSGKQREDFY